MTSSLQETMQIVMQAQEVQQHFFQNIADLFRLIEAELEEMEPAYTPLLEQGGVWHPSPTAALRGSKSWSFKHMARPFQALEDAEEPLLLLHVCTDPSFVQEPELWIGLFPTLRGDQGQSQKEAFEYLFQDYFGPEEDWQEHNTWYEDQVQDEMIEAKLSFCRILLSSLDDIDAIRQKVCMPIQERLAQQD